MTQMNTLNPAYFDDHRSDFRASDSDQAVAIEASEAVSDARSVMFATLLALGATILGIYLAS
jgi:hypothetical protein